MLIHIHISVVRLVVMIVHCKKANIKPKLLEIQIRITGSATLEVHTVPIAGHSICMLVVSTQKRKIFTKLDTLNRLLNGVCWWSM